MGVDKSYGSGKPRTAANSAARRRIAAGKFSKSNGSVLAKRNAAAAPSMARDKYSAKTVGALKGVAKGAIKVADYAFNGPKEAQKYSAYGFDSSFALPIGKLIEAAKGLRAAGKIGQAAALEARIAAKVGGQIGKRASAIGNAGRGPFSAANFAKENAAIKSITNRDITAKGARAASESVFPRKTFDSGSNVSEGTMNIVDTRRMNPAQAKSALEGGVNQTTKIKRRVPSAPKKVNKVTKRLLGGR